jgi:hypothetical protein
MLDRATTFRRYTATLLVALWIMPVVAGLAHSQEHAHRYCPEHQTFEETVRGSGQVQSRLAGNVPQLFSRLPDTGVDSTRPTHESCPLLTASTRDEAPAQVALILASAGLTTNHPATAPPRPLTSVPILATAPKSSPPARA